MLMRTSQEDDLQEYLALSSGSQFCLSRLWARSLPSLVASLPDMDVCDLPRLGLRVSSPVFFVGGLSALVLFFPETGLGGPAGPEGVHFYMNSGIITMTLRFPDPTNPKITSP